MIGDDYFDVRSRLGSALFAMGRLAEEAGVAPPIGETINSLVAGLKDPFVFVVVGEVNAGKSMLLNALFGADFCPTAAVPLTDRICYFRHGFTRQETDHSPTLREIRLPYTFLHDFHIVDTPGVNSVAEGHDLITQEFIPRADLVLFVFPATNPWGAQAWEFLGRIHQDYLKKVVIVLQQMDLRSEEEVHAIVEHMKYWSRRRFGFEFAVFPVSAQKALLARTTGVDKQRLLTESRFAALEDHLAEIVAATPQRQEKLRNTVRIGQVLLQQVNRALGRSSSRLASERDALFTILHAVAGQEAITRQKCEPLLQGIEADYLQASKETEALLAEKLTFFKSLRHLLSRSRLGEMLKRSLAMKLTDVVRKHSAGPLEIIESDLATVWNLTQPMLDKALGSRRNHDAAPPIEDPDATEHLLSQLEDSIRKRLDPQSLATRLATPLKRRRRTLLGILSAGLLAAGGGGVLLSQGQTLAGTALLAVGGLMPGIAAIFSRRNARTLREELTAYLQGNREQLMASLKETFSVGLRQRFASFLHFFKPLQELAENHRVTHEPRVQEFEALQRNFAEMEKLLG